MFSQKRLVAGAVAALVSVLALATFSGASAQTVTPNPVTCEGYPEPRIYIENQSWWEPQEADYRDTDHPGAGKQGHIHVSGCFPVFSHTFDGTETIHFDLRIQYHNMTGYTNQLRADIYGDRNYDVPRALWQSKIGHCDTIDCDNWVSFDVSLQGLQYSGVKELNIYPIVWESQGGPAGPWEKQYNITRYYINVQNGQPPPPPGAVAANVQISQSRVGGDSWYQAGAGSYARVGFERDKAPWNPTTGELTPLSGTWSLEVGFEKRKRFVYIDPALHATPSPHYGTILLDDTAPSGNTKKTIVIDTTTLSNGVHRLLIGTGNPGVSKPGMHSGVVVIRFLVDNPEPDPCVHPA